MVECLDIMPTHAVMKNKIKNYTQKSCIELSGKVLGKQKTTCLSAYFSFRYDPGSISYRL